MADFVIFKILQIVTVLWRLSVIKSIVMMSSLE